jgi:hypothetical protein
MSVWNVSYSRYEGRGDYFEVKQIQVEAPSPEEAQRQAEERLVAEWGQPRITPG